jgi:hypothetical protein
MTRRITTVLACVLSLGAPALLPGCAKDQGGSRPVEDGVEYTVVVQNESKHAVDVTWWVAYRSIDGDELGTPVERKMGVIEPEGTAQDVQIAIGMAPSSELAECVQVFRIRLVIPSASWQEPARMWWEVIGPLPKEFVVENGPGPDSFKVKLRGDGAALEAVPRQLWTDEGEPAP